MSARALIMAGLAAAWPASADDGSDGGITESTEEKCEERLNLPSTWETQRHGRALSLQIPAPRGQITDRTGRPLAQNVVAHQLAIEFPRAAGWKDKRVIDYARRRIERAGELLGRDIEASDGVLLNHYRKRRWVPCVLTGVLSGEEATVIEEEALMGLRASPFYLRRYPEETTACHIVGYVGKKCARSTDVLLSGEPLWPECEGRDGLEATFDRFLTGENGTVNYVFDRTGEKLHEKNVARPVPGHNVVTTLDLDMQLLAESTLGSHCRRGAFVVIDVTNGDILAMASRPTFDLNVFVPALSTETYAGFREDPDIPLFARAFRGVYPPASTFKISTALAVLDCGQVTPSTLISGPPSLKIGNRYFKNWSRYSEGRLTVAGAIMRSCNTWFYQAALDAGATPLSAMANRLGFGQKTGLPLRAEAAGFVPDEENTQARFDHALSHGYLANMSIGQGTVAVTPLQVARMMAAVANRGRLPDLRLVRQVQDLHGKIVESYPTVTPRLMGLDPDNVEAVADGMIAVVHSGGGTGRSAAIYRHRLAGKTGTGQWGPAGQRKYVAWFAGFVPADEPQYAFAAIYEGKPGETVSGGAKAAPMVRRFFNRIYSSGWASR